MSKQKRKIISRALSLIALFAGIYAGTVAVWTYSVTPVAITEAKSRGLFQLDSFPTEV